MATSNSPNTVPKTDGRFRLFAPILAGATLRDRMIACLGAILGISLTGIVSGYIFESDFHLPLIIAPLGASAVLLFVVPASPLAQPWPIIGGNILSAFIGVTVAYFVHDPMIATGLGVSLATMAMSFARCLSVSPRSRGPESPWASSSMPGLGSPIPTVTRRLWT